MDRSETSIRDHVGAMRPPSTTRHALRLPSGRGATTAAENRTGASHRPDDTGTTLEPGVRNRRRDGTTERRRARFGRRHARQVASRAVATGEARTSPSRDGDHAEHRFRVLVHPARAVVLCGPATDALRQRVDHEWGSDRSISTDSSADRRRATTSAPYLGRQRSSTRLTVPSYLSRVLRPRAVGTASGTWACRRRADLDVAMAFEDGLAVTLEPTEHRDVADWHTPVRQQA